MDLLYKNISQNRNLKTVAKFGVKGMKMPITCPNCTIEAGFEAQPYWQQNNSLSLKGQSFKFTLFQKSSFDVCENTYCCILCGHVWAKANIKNLREVISKFGSEEMKKIIILNRAN